MLPPDRVVYNPPRPADNPGSVQVQPAAQPPQDQSQNPAPADDANQPPVRGVIVKTDTILGEGLALSRPKAADVDKDGNIYVFTEKDSKLHKLSADGKELKSWDVTDANNPVPEGSAVVIKGDNVYVLNAATSNLIGFNLDGQPTGIIHLCVCFYPRSASLARDGNFWVSNTGTGVVLKVNDKGETLATLGSLGSDPGQFKEPAGVWEAADGTIYVADISNNRVQSFTPDLKPISQWNMGQSVARDGNRLSGDADGNVLVTEYEGRDIVKYDKEGKELGRWAYRGKGGAPSPQASLSPRTTRFIVLYPDTNQGIIFNPKKQ